MVAILFTSWRELFTHSFFIIFIGILFLGMMFFEYCYSHWRDLKVPTLPAMVPFGHFRSFIFQRQSFVESLMDLYFKLKTYGKSYGGTYMFIKPILMVLDPELAKNILIKDFNHFTDRSICEIDKKINPLSNHLLHMKGEKWNNLRSKISPAFTPGNLKTTFPILKSTLKTLESTLKSVEEFSGHFDVQDLMERFTTDVIASVVFGISSNSLENNSSEFRKNAQKAARVTRFQSFAQLLLFSFPKIARALQLSFVSEDVKEYFINLVKDTIRQRKEKRIDRKDFLQILMKLHEEGENGQSSKDSNVALTTEEIAAQCFMFILAGFETSASTLTSVMYYLSINNEIQIKVRQEILSVLSKNNGQLTYEALQEMTYTQQVIDETLRIRPAVSVLPRVCTKSYKVPGEQFTIPAGTSVMIPIRAFQNDPEYFPNPEVFDPERFSVEEQNKRSFCAYVPFGAGSRQCIGGLFAMMQIKVGLVALLKNYKYTLNSKTKIPVRENPIKHIYNVIEGVWINISKLS